MTIKFIDLFAGIGGIRLGFENAAKKLGIETECVFTSEINKYSCQVYRDYFKEDTHDPENDVTLCDEKKLPSFNVLLAGFPCQAFSIAGKRGGFEDTRGTLFFDVARIIKQKKPDAFLLENVKGLENHRGGKTLETILGVLREDLKYKSTICTILNSKDFGVPQNRPRIYIVGIKKPKGVFEFPTGERADVRLGSILEEKPVSVKYFLSETYLECLRRHRSRHEAKGNGFGFEIKSRESIASAIVAGGMGRERNLVLDKRLRDFKPLTNIRGRVNREGVRKMTPREWERLQGFPDDFTKCVSDAQRYKQLGNAVSVPVIEAVAENLINCLDLNKQAKVAALCH